VIKAASAVNHLTLCLVRITTIYHFDWTTSFLSDTGRIRLRERGSQEKNRGGHKERWGFSGGYIELGEGGVVLKGVESLACP